MCSTNGAAFRAAQLIELQRPQEALDVLGHAIATDDADPRLRFLLAIALLELDRAKEACAAARDAIARDPESAIAHQTLARAYMRRARKTRSGLARSQFLRDAHEAAHDAVVVDVESPDSYMVLAEVSAMRSQFDEAIASARRAVQLAPDSSAAHVTVSYVALAIKDSATAEAAAREALALDPESAAAAVNLSEALTLRGQHKESADALTDAARLDPVRYGPQLDRHWWRRYETPVWIATAVALVAIVLVVSDREDLGHRLGYLTIVFGIVAFRAVQRWEARRKHRAGPDGDA